MLQYREKMKTLPNKDKVARIGKTFDHVIFPFENILIN